MMDHRATLPILDPIPADRQGAKRHYGVHPYFTRRPFNVVRDYILRYSREGDVVLDPYGGSGVTAIEAFLENRVGIQNDLNPLANFIAGGIANLARGTLSDYRRALAHLEETCAQRLNALAAAQPARVTAILKEVELPENIRLPSNSDVEYLFDLFEPRQLAALAIVRMEIQRLHNKYAREGMLLALSATISKLNRTFLSADGRAESRGGSSIFSIYRYKVAKRPITLSPWETFHERATNVLDAKTEIDRAIELKRRTGGWHGKFQLLNCDVLNLPRKLNGCVDYIFTDPPYGGHIAYLDLSTMWNAWLGILPSKKAKAHEIIVGGDANISDETYVKRLGESVSVCVELLKAGRWLSIVFQHWNVAYFHSILSAAARSGAELRAAVSQVGDPIWSMHKKKGSDRVLAGELILTFCKTGIPIEYATGEKFDLEANVRELLRDAAEPLYGEKLFNSLILRAWDAGAIDSINVSKGDLSSILEGLGWRYDPASHRWTKNPGRAGAFDFLARSGAG